jgi:hypothetical protein
MTQRMNEKFVSTDFDREQRLKKDYNAVKLILSKSGFGWDTNLNMVATVLENWDELPENLQRWKDNPSLTMMTWMRFIMVVFYLG